MDIKKFKLYHYPLTRSSRVRWLLHEIFDDNFELETVNIHNGQLHNKILFQLIHFLYSIA